MTLALLLAIGLASSGSAAPSASVSSAEFTSAAESHLSDVEEFKFIQSEASKLGVRVWLFGGTAAGYAHYIKWDLERQKGDPRFQPDRFDYDYTNIYRSTQDADLVIDGTLDQAAQLQNALATKYPHLQGSKSVWEVRLLKAKVGDKVALLDNPDYLNQNTDSNSTGMIELTKPKPGEARVRDLLDWKNQKDPIFLEDVLHDDLHFYQSNLHKSTSRAKEGLNPPILSVIRYLTKAFQYELKISPEDESKIRQIIDRFNPEGNDLKNSYVQNWIEKNGKKLVQNAVNIEYALDELDRLGLKRKLSLIQNNPDSLDSLSWWLNKEPLRSQRVGKGFGKTAKDFGITVVAHETKSFAAYESITRAHTGDPNVLISRDGAAGEAASYGDGFYTQVGRTGAVGTGLTIRFTVDPNAREGTDFVQYANNYFIFRNKNALKVIPESLNMNLIQYMEFLLNDSSTTNSDLALFEKLNRRIFKSTDALPPDEIKQILSIVKTAAKIGKNSVLDVWFKRKESQDHPEVFDWMMDGASSPYGLKLLETSDWSKNIDIPKFVYGSIPAALRDGKPEILNAWFKLKESSAHPEVIDQIMRSRLFAYALPLLNQSEWKNKLDIPQLIAHFLQSHPAERMPFDSNDRINSDYKPFFDKLGPDTLSPVWQANPNLVEQLLNSGYSRIALSQVMTKNWSLDHPEWWFKIDTHQYLVEAQLSSTLWKDQKFPNKESLELLNKADHGLRHNGLYAWTYSYNQVSKTILENTEKIDEELDEYSKHLDIPVSILEKRLHLVNKIDPKFVNLLAQLKSKTDPSQVRLHPFADQIAIQILSHPEIGPELFSKEEATHRTEKVIDSMSAANFKVNFSHFAFQKGSLIDDPEVFQAFTRKFPEHFALLTSVAFQTDRDEAWEPILVQSLQNERFNETDLGNTLIKRITGPSSLLLQPKPFKALLSNITETNKSGRGFERNLAFSELLKKSHLAKMLREDPKLLVKIMRSLNTSNFYELGFNRIHLLTTPEIYGQWVDQIKNMGSNGNHRAAILDLSSEPLTEAWFPVVSSLIQLLNDPANIRLATDRFVNDPKAPRRTEAAQLLLEQIAYNEKEHARKHYKDSELKELHNIRDQILSTGLIKNLPILTCIRLAIFAP